MNMSKKSLVASLAIGTILFEILTVSTYSMDYATLKQENSIEEKFNISNDTVTPENIRSHPANINVTLNTVVEQLKKLGKYKFVWNNDVLEISLKFNKNVNTPLLKFQKSGNVINGYDLWTFAGGSLEHKSIGSASLQELDDKKWQLNNSFKNCETQFILFKQTKAKLDKLMNKDELSDDDAKSINDLRFKFNDCVKILDTARIQANERHKAIVELYLDILGFSKRDRISENPFIQIETSSVNDYKDWRDLLEQSLKYDEFKMLMYSFILNESEIERNGKNIFTPDKKLTLVLDQNQQASYYASKHSIILNLSTKTSDDQKCDKHVFISETMTNSIEFRNFSTRNYRNTSDEIISLFHELLHAVHFAGRNNLFCCNIPNLNRDLMKTYGKYLIDCVKHQFYIPDNHTYNLYEAKLILNRLVQFLASKVACIDIKSVEELFAITGLPYKSFFGYGLSEDLLNFNIGCPIKDAHLFLTFRYNTDAIVSINGKSTHYSDLIKYNLQQVNNYFRNSNYKNDDKIEYLPRSSGKIFGLQYSCSIECYSLGTRFDLQIEDKPTRNFFRSLELASNGVYGVQSSFTEQSLVDFIAKISQLSIGFSKISEYNRTLTEKKSLLDNEFTIKTNKLLEDFEKSQDDTNLYEAQVEYLQWITDHTEFLKNINTVVGTVVGYANTNLIELKNIYQNTPDELERLKNKFLTPYLELEPLTKLEVLNCPQIDYIYSFQDSKVAKEHFDKIKEVYVPLSHNIDVIKNKLATFFKKIDANIAV